MIAQLIVFILIFLTLTVLMCFLFKKYLIRFIMPPEKIKERLEHCEKLKRDLILLKEESSIMENEVMLTKKIEKLEKKISTLKNTL